MVKAIDMVDGHAASHLWRITRPDNPHREEDVERFWDSMQRMADEVNNARSS